MGLSVPTQALYLVDIVYERWIDSRFTFVYKGILVIMQGCTGIIELSLWIRLID